MRYYLPHATQPRMRAPFAPMVQEFGMGMARHSMLRLVDHCVHLAIDITTSLLLVHLLQTLRLCSADKDVVDWDVDCETLVLDSSIMTSA